MAIGYCTELTIRIAAKRREISSVMGAGTLWIGIQYTVGDIDR